MSKKLEARRAAATGRETRNFTVAPLESRQTAEGALGLAGYASVTEAPYEITDWLGDYTEVIRAGAFSKTLAEQDDVRLLLNHDGLPLARTKSGTLKLSEVMSGSDDPQGRGQTGLWTEATLDSRSGLANDVKIAMERGDLDQMSFAFQVVRQEWSPDFTQRDILEARLFDVSVVTYPANPATSVDLRSARIAAVTQRLREGRKLDPEDVNMLTQALAWLGSIDSIVDEAQESLAAYLGVPNPDADDMPEMDGAMPPARSVVPIDGEGRGLSLLRAQAESLRLRSA